MNNKIRVLAVIPARGGSKGIPRKNIRLLSGKPLISYSIETALKSSSFKDYALWLGNTPYQKILEGAEAGELKKIEVSLWKSLVEVNEKILSMSPGSVKKFMELRVKGFEVLVLKNLINFKSAGEVEKDYTHYFIDKKIKQKAEKLKSAKDVPELVGMLSDTEYGEILKPTLEDGFLFKAHER